MTEEEYLRDRLENQLRWHSDKAAENQKKYKLFQLIVIIAGALVPLFTSVSDTDAVYTKWIVGLLGVVVAGTAAAISLYKFQENWVQYRIIAEALKTEQFLFATKAPPYDGPDPFKDLVVRVEEILVEQQRKWKAIVGPTT